MPQNTSEENPLARHGAISYLEIAATDPRRSATFYEHVAGWQIDERAERDFRFSGGGGRLIGRWVVGRVASPEPGLLPLIYVSDLDSSLASVVRRGGEIVELPYLEGDVRVARIRDPAGNLLGLWQFASR